MEDAKVYGLCLGRLKYQIGQAREKTGRRTGERVLLESYLSSDPEDIIDILELYDIEKRTESAVREKLADLAYTASVLMRETLEFGTDGDGNVGLFLVVPETAPAAVAA